LIIENEENIIQDVIASKQEWWTVARERYPFLDSSSFVEYPETVEAFQNIIHLIDISPTDELSATEISKVRQRFGIPHSAVNTILEHFGRTVDWNKTNAEKRNYSNCSVKYVERRRSVEKCLSDIGITSDDSLKHNYLMDDTYTFPDVEALLLAIVDDQAVLSVDVERDRLPDILKETSRAEVCLRDREFGFVCDRTHFTTEGGNQFYDTGYIVLDGGFSFKVNSVKKFEDLVIHYVEPLFR